MDPPCLCAWALPLLEPTTETAPFKVMASFAYPWEPTRVLQRHSAHFFDGRAFQGYANNTLHTTWNTTRCKVASFFLFIFTVFWYSLLYTSSYTCFAIARALSEFAHAVVSGSIVRVRFQGFAQACTWRRGFCTLVHLFIQLLPWIVPRLLSWTQRFQLNVHAYYNTRDY